MPISEAGPHADGPPLIAVLSGPSGAGKDTVLREALRREPVLASVVTVKTRAPRPGEEQGVHQIFLSEQEFDEWLARDAFLEHAEVYGHRSGVPRDQVRELLAAGKTVVIRTDVQGARTLRERVPQAVLIFLTAPDRETLRARLAARGHDADVDLERRLAAAEAEMNEAALFDHVVVNREGSEGGAVDELLAVLASERAKPGRAAPKV